MSKFLHKCMSILYISWNWSCGHVNCHVGAMNQTLVLCKNKCCNLSHLSNLLYGSSFTQDSMSYV